MGYGESSIRRDPNMFGMITSIEQALTWPGEKEHRKHFPEAMGLERAGFAAIGVARELAEDKTSTGIPKALELSEKFKTEYQKMLQEPWRL